MNLKTFRLFAELDDHDRRVLGEYLEQQRVPAGHCVFREGDAATALVLLAKGRLQVENRRTGRLGTLGPGASLGEASLVRVGAREATVTAARSALILRLERSSMRVMLDDAPHTAARVLEAVAGGLADTLHGFVEDVAVDPAARDA